MSSVIVPLTTIESVEPHPNADRLEVAKISGWQVVVGKGTYQAGDPVIYVPPDALVPQEWSDRWGVTAYLSNGRVRSIKLRGEPSFGFSVKPGVEEYAALAQDGMVIPLEYGDVIDDVSSAFGITKYVPQPSATRIQNARNEDPRLARFTDIENLRHYGSGFTEGEAVVVTEKIHGTCSRLALIEGEYMAASKRVQRDRDITEADDIQFSTSCRDTYWFPLSVPGVNELLVDFGKRHKQVILFGEIYGPSIQKGFDYGVQPGELGYVAFDLMLDGKYVDAEQFEGIREEYGLTGAPTLYAGPYDAAKIKGLTKGRSTLGGSHIREGVVVRSATEQRHPKFGRKVLKLVSDEFLTGNNEDLQETA